MACRTGSKLETFIKISDTNSANVYDPFLSLHIQVSGGEK